MKYLYRVTAIFPEGTPTQIQRVFHYQTLRAAQRRAWDLKYQNVEGFPNAISTVIERSKPIEW